MVASFKVGLGMIASVFAADITALIAVKIKWFPTAPASAVIQASNLRADFTIMTAQPLLDLLLPAYSPCQHFGGACVDACTWQPDRGIVPCAFGGATGALDDVQLVIVTAEPGNPQDDAVYRGSPTDMLHNALRIFTEAMQRGGLNRPGRPTPFHRNMREILDCF